MARTHETITLNRRDFLRLSGAGLARCGGGGTIGGGGSTFVFGRGDDSIGLDPINVTDGESLRATRQIFDSLLRFEPGSFDVAPALATEIPKPENGGLSYSEGHKVERRRLLARAGRERTVQVRRVGEELPDTRGG